mmetsp:Transcript_18839/g.43807  ORF Transcript_18839/g.43807 Transcript_18839/m.43807 type:complete len:261 (+) Transcript_18839:635-1417(+)
MSSQRFCSALGGSSLISTLSLHLWRTNRQDGLSRLRRHEVQGHILVLMDPSRSFHLLTLALCLGTLLLPFAIVIRLRLPGVQQRLHRLTCHSRGGQRLSRGKRLALSAPPASARGSLTRLTLFRIVLLLRLEVCPALRRLAQTGIFHLRILIVAFLFFATVASLQYRLWSVASSQLLLQVEEQRLMRFGHMLHKCIHWQDPDEALHDASSKHLRCGQVPVEKHAHHGLQEHANLLARKNEDHHLAELQRSPVHLRILVFQ